MAIVRQGDVDPHIYDAYLVAAFVGFGFGVYFGIRWWFNRNQFKKCINKIRERQVGPIGEEGKEIKPFRIRRITLRDTHGRAFKMTAYMPVNRVLIVTYNLKGAATSYTQFYEALKTQGPWWHYLPSTWLVFTAKTPSDVADALRLHIQTGDHVFVGTLQDGYNGWVPKDAWEWLKTKGISP